MAYHHILWLSIYISVWFIYIMTIYLHLISFAGLVSKSTCKMEKTRKNGSCTSWPEWIPRGQFALEDNRFQLSIAHGPVAFATTVERPSWFSEPSPNRYNNLVYLLTQNIVSLKKKFKFTHFFLNILIVFDIPISWNNHVL